MVTRVGWHILMGLPSGVQKRHRGYDKRSGWKRSTLSHLTGKPSLRYLIVPYFLHVWLRTFSCTLSRLLQWDCPALGGVQSENFYFLAPLANSSLSVPQFSLNVTSVENATSSLPNYVKSVASVNLTVSAPAPFSFVSTSFLGRWNDNGQLFLPGTVMLKHRGVCVLELNNLFLVYGIGVSAAILRLGRSHCKCTVLYAARANRRVDWSHSKMMFHVCRDSERQASCLQWCILVRTCLRQCECFLVLVLEVIETPDTLLQPISLLCSGVYVRAMKRGTWRWAPPSWRIVATWICVTNVTWFVWQCVTAGWRTKWRCSPSIQ